MSVLACIPSAAPLNSFKHCTGAVKIIRHMYLCIVCEVALLVFNAPFIILLYAKRVVKVARFNMSKVSIAHQRSIHRST